MRPSQLEAYAKEKPGRTATAQHVVAHLDGYLSANQLGITIASLALGFLGEPFVEALVAPMLEMIGIPVKIVSVVSFVLAIGSFTFLHVVVGEWTETPPLVLGHEGCGIVEAVGDGVSHVAAGDRVVLSWFAPCSACRTRTPSSCSRATGCARCRCPPCARRC